MKSRIGFLGGAGEVTGSNFLLECGGLKILIDCGLIQGSSFAPEENRKSFDYEPSSIDFLLVTHAHLDHIGRIPKLIRDGFKGFIYSTEITKEISELMFVDALSLLQTEESKSGLEKLYDKNDVSGALNLWKGINYYENIDLGNGINFSLKDAGHILGSAIIEVERNGKKVVFSGDLGNSPSPLLKDTDKLEGADYLVIESVYGDKEHEPKSLKDKKLGDLIRDTIKKGGEVVIPAFSLERTQNILYSLNNLIEEGEIPSVPVFLDSPLAIKVTEIYKRHYLQFNKEVREEIKTGDDIFNFPKLSFTTTNRESDEIERSSGPKIIIAGSGMSMGGRITKHEKRLLPDPKNTIILVGYQSLGTSGRLLEEGIKKITIDGVNVTVRAKIENIRGFSSHKDSKALLDFVSGSSRTLKKVFVAMGEHKSSSFLSQRINDYLDIEAVVPKKGEFYEIEF